MFAASACALHPTPLPPPSPLDHISTSSSLSQRTSGVGCVIKSRVFELLILVRICSTPGRKNDQYPARHSVCPANISETAVNEPFFQNQTATAPHRPEVVGFSIRSCPLLTTRRVRAKQRAPFDIRDDGAGDTAADRVSEGADTDSKEGGHPNKYVIEYCSKGTAAIISGPPEAPSDNAKNRSHRRP
jgi:hypothetical protein